MTLPKPPSLLSEEEVETLIRKFAEHEISHEQEKRQQKLRDEL